MSGGGRTDMTSESEATSGVFLVREYHKKDRFFEDYNCYRLVGLVWCNSHATQFLFYLSLPSHRVEVCGREREIICDSEVELGEREKIQKEGVKNGRKYIFNILV